MAKKGPTNETGKKGEPGEPGEPEFVRVEFLETTRRDGGVYAAGHTCQLPAAEAEALAADEALKILGAA